MVIYPIKISSINAQIQCDKKRWFKSSETFKDDEMYIKLLYIAGAILKNEYNTQNEVVHR